MGVWFSHTVILWEERGPVDGCEVWFYPHKNPVRGERTSGWLCGLVLPTQKSCERREDKWMVVWSGFTHTKILLKERGPVDGCEVWFYPHKNPIKEERGPVDGCEVGFTHTIILLKERGPVDGCEVWFFPHNNPVKGERASGWLRGLVLPTQ